eukprot:Rmarinus@m.17088
MARSPFFSSRIGTSLSFMVTGRWRVRLRHSSRVIFGFWWAVVTSYLIMMILIANDSREGSEFSDTLDTLVTILRVCFIFIGLSMGAFTATIFWLAYQNQEAEMFLRYGLEHGPLVRWLLGISVLLLLRPVYAVCLVALKEDLIYYDENSEALLLNSFYYIVFETLPCAWSLHQFGYKREQLSSDVLRSIESSYHRKSSVLSVEAEGALKEKLLVDEYEAKPEDVTLQERVGCGSTGTVWRGSWCGTTVAVKRLHFPLSAKDEIPDEVRVMTHLRHPRVVQFLAFVVFPDALGSEDHNIALVTEFMEGGSLYDILYGEDAPMTGGVPMPLAAWIAKDIAEGMAYLHAARICHRDLKPMNVLLTRSCVAKICDFGISTAFDANRTMITNSSGLCGTLPYLAPELISGSRLVPTLVDVYAFAIVCYETLTGRSPYPDSWRMYQIEDFVLSGQRPALAPEHFDAAPLLCELIQACWAHEPSVRPDFPTIVKQLQSLELPPRETSLSPKLSSWLITR